MLKNIKSKKGSAFRFISTAIGAILVLIAVYFLTIEKIVHGAILGFIGILIIALSLMAIKK